MPFFQFHLIFLSVHKTFLKFLKLKLVKLKSIMYNNDQKQATLQFANVETCKVM